LHHGVEAGDFLAALEEEDVDALGAFEAFEVAGGVGEVFAIDGVAEIFLEGEADFFCSMNETEGSRKTP
jgi:hypothetical protein